jgi:hypothetical protein
MMWRTVAALVALAICAVAAPGTASAFKPVEGKYRATVAGTTTKNVFGLEAQRRNRTYRTRVLQVTDDCAASAFKTPIGMGRLFAKDFKYQSTITVGTISYGLDIDGLFTSAKRATVRVKTTETNLAPLPGAPPSAAKLCEDITSFTLRLVKAAKRDK